MSIRNAVIVRDLIKVYKTGDIEVQALRGVNVNVRKGEMVSLIGPSGSGKTTLLNIIGGLDQPTAGTVRVFDTDLSNMTPGDLVNFRRTTVGHVFQNMNLIPTLSAAENVEMPMAALGIPAKNRERKVEELISVVGMKDRMNHKPGELSGGEQQRIALAAALANDPPLVLADEPTGELDTENARIVVEYLRKINQELGKTVIMVTHDPNISRISDRILRINDGIVKADVAPTLTQEQPDYGEMIKNRIAEIEANLEALEGQFKAGTLTGNEYAERQTKYKQTIEVLNDELHRLGVV
ncbi:ATP-binding cassette domain-containing protein [Candidatus Bathyarchaeota archaeon]|nr:ATP-binding cassette domain-containing protein [Candidatus Bathyarchaeota archaeon]